MKIIVENIIKYNKILDFIDDRRCLPVTYVYEFFIYFINILINFDILKMS